MRALFNIFIRDLQIKSDTIWYRRMRQSYKQRVQSILSTIKFKIRVQWIKGYDPTFVRKLCWNSAVKPSALRLRSSKLTLIKITLHVNIRFKVQRFSAAEPLTIHRTNINVITDDTAYKPWVVTEQLQNKNV